MVSDKKPQSILENIVKVKENSSEMLKKIRLANKLKEEERKRKRKEEKKLNP